MTLLLTFFFVLSTIILFYINITPPIKNLFFYWETFYTMGSGFTMSGVVSSLFYYIVVYLPEQRQRKIIKENIQKTYTRVKKDLALAIIHASNKGGRNELSANQETINKMLTRKGFRELFEGGINADEGFYAFENQMTTNTPEYEEIIFHLKILLRSIKMVLDNYRIDNNKTYDFFRNLEIHLYKIEHNGCGYDESKLLCTFIWEIFAGWDFIEGYINFDKVEKLIKEI